jgi:hypothetical protein
MWEYPDKDNAALLHFAAYYLIKIGDKRISFIKNNDEYIILGDAIKEVITDKFGITSNPPHTDGNDIVLIDGKYHVKNYFQEGSGLTKIDNAEKLERGLVLHCYTVDSKGNRNSIPSYAIDGGPSVYDFTAVVEQSEYGSWILLEFLPMK